MRRRLLINLAVVALAGLLAAVAWLDLERGDETPRLTGVTPGEVRVVRIQDADGETLSMERSDGRWMITEPVEAPASEFHVKQLLELSRAPSERRYGLDDVDARELGLIPPQIKIAFNGTGIGLGDTEPMDDLRYALVEDQVHLIPDGLMPLLDGPWWNFLDRHLLPRDATVTALATDALAGHLTDDGWEVERGELDVDAFAELAAAWSEAEALVARPLDDPPDADAPDVRLRLDQGGERRFVATEESGEIRLVDMDSRVAYVLPEHVRGFLLDGQE
ncbi:hypothetical protein [Aquisalimonas asiatica]|uniref:DUF4340 domain-containing protein n=1 Tax=Aquisalimonas asiatica TaxID=406100 RepID=A0A1H8VGN5_9GAMM|nr:hypothetical protein [Aquisalimonas asiatica]SEP14444.1 hypothetical protein SAMN04488052_11251 [Aquisalimonas asiatica]